jgi:hypothetical protein
MPCYRCGTRQVDPARGHSPWQRGVRDDQQVLICPGCQTAHDWTAELDQCGRCGSVRLVRRLGEVECRECGFVASPECAAGGPERASRAGGEAAGLSEEVARALDRVLGRSAWGSGPEPGDQGPGDRGPGDGPEGQSPGSRGTGSRGTEGRGTERRSPVGS